MKQNDLSFLCAALGGPEDTKKRPSLGRAHTLEVPFYGTMMVTSNGRFAHAISVGFGYGTGREWDISGRYAREVGPSGFTSMLEAILCPPNPPQELALECWPKGLTASTLRNLSKAGLCAAFHHMNEDGFIFDGFVPLFPLQYSKAILIPDRLVGVTAGGEVVALADRVIFYAADGQRIVAVAREK